MRVFLLTEASRPDPAGAAKTYLNPQRQAFQPIQDTRAFDTCPGD